MDCEQQRPTGEVASLGVMLAFILSSAREFGMTKIQVQVPGPQLKRNHQSFQVGRFLFFVFSLSWVCFKRQKFSSAHSSFLRRGLGGTHDPSPFLQQPHVHLACEKGRVMDASVHWLCPGDRDGSQQPGALLSGSLR